MVEGKIYAKHIIKHWSKKIQKDSTLTCNIISKESITWPKNGYQSSAERVPPPKCGPICTHFDYTLPSNRYVPRVPHPPIMLHNISHPSNSRKIQATCYYILLHKYKPRVPHYMSILNQNNFAFYTWRSCLPKQPRKINHTNQPITFSDLSHLIYFNSS